MFGEVATKTKNRGNFGSDVGDFENHEVSSIGSNEDAVGVDEDG